MCSFDKIIVFIQTNFGGGFHRVFIDIKKNMLYNSNMDKLFDTKQF